MEDALDGYAFRSFSYVQVLLVTQVDERNGACIEKLLRLLSRCSVKHA